MLYFCYDFIIGCFGCNKLIYVFYLGFFTVIKKFIAAACICYHSFTFYRHSAYIINFFFHCSNISQYQLVFCIGSLKYGIVRDLFFFGFGQFAVCLVCGGYFIRAVRSNLAYRVYESAHSRRAGKADRHNIAGIVLIIYRAVLIADKARDAVLFIPLGIIKLRKLHHCALGIHTDHGYSAGL